MNMNLDVDGRRVGIQDISNFKQELNMQTAELVTTFDVGDKLAVKQSLISSPAASTAPARVLTTSITSSVPTNGRKTSIITLTPTAWPSLPCATPRKQPKPWA
jgi:trehalose/maltose hydrolase-like predicted phosphorylase